MQAPGIKTRVAEKEKENKVSGAPTRTGCSKGNSYLRERLLYLESQNCYGWRRPLKSASPAVQPYLLSAGCKDFLWREQKKVWGIEEHISLIEKNYFCEILPFVFNINEMHLDLWRHCYKSVKILHCKNYTVWGPVHFFLVWAGPLPDFFDYYQSENHTEKATWYTEF